MEEHDIHGGLGGAVAEVLAQKAPARLRIMGLPNEKLMSGTSAEVFARYGLTPRGIADAVLSGR